MSTKQAGQLAAFQTFLGKAASFAGDTAYWTSAINDVNHGFLGGKEPSQQRVQPWMLSAPVAAYEADGGVGTRAAHGAMAGVGALAGTEAGRFGGGLAGHLAGMGAAPLVSALAGTGLGSRAVSAMSRMPRSNPVTSALASFGVLLSDPELTKFFLKAVGGGLGSGYGGMWGAQGGAELGQRGARALVGG